MPTLFRVELFVKACEITALTYPVLLKGTCRVEKARFTGGERILRPQPQHTVLAEHLPAHWDWRNVSGRLHTKSSRYLFKMVAQNTARKCGAN